MTLSWINNITFGTWWNWILEAPVYISPVLTSAATDAELAPIITAMNNANYTYNWTVIQTIQAWANNVTITASGSNFIITTSFITSQIWKTLYIYRSTDGTTWQTNVPSATCTVWANNSCSFDTNHLTYFAFASINTTPVSSWGNGGGWWGGWRYIDYCPNWDYSPSYYDNLCGTKPIINNTNWTQATVINKSPVITDTINTDKISTDSIQKYLNTNINPKNLQIALKYILNLKKTSYSNLSTNNSKINFWKNIIKNINKKLKNENLSKDNKEIYIAIKYKAIKLIIELNDIKTNNNENINKIASTETIKQTSPIDDIEPKWLIKIYKYINVEKSYAIRQYNSFSSKIITFLTRNTKVELIAYYNSWWSKIKFNDSIWYIRTKYLRDENEGDRNRNISIKIFYETSLQTDVNMRKIKVANSINVRSLPNMNSKIKAILPNNENVLILDQINWWSEIKWKDGTWFILSKYIWE